MSSSKLSKEFFDLVKAIGESRSKQEEDAIILREMRLLKSLLSEQKVSPKKMKEYLIRMVYIEMLGHDASFGHIHGVNMLPSDKLMFKRVAYTAVSLTLNPEHEFIVLLLNTIQGDLKSDNFLVVNMALTSVCKLVSAPNIPMLKPLVVPLLGHSEPAIRKKAVMALHRFSQINPDTVMDQSDAIKKVLCDRDPAVMGACLCLLEDLTRKDPLPWKDLVPSFVSILKQVIEKRLPRDFEYHRIPAPWIQIRLLRILSFLGQNDQKMSQGMYSIILEAMKRADININVGFAIVYECVQTITSIYPDANMIEDAALSISRFITSDNHNLKYLGVNALAAIVQINPKYAAEHQLTVIDCLEDPDETLKRKTLDLLYSMTNPHNVVVIVEKLLDFLRKTNDVYLRTELVSRIHMLAEKYAASNSWYIDTLQTVFELGGELVKPEVAHQLMRLIAEDEDEDGAEMSIRQYAVASCVEQLSQMRSARKKQLPDISLQVICWVLGEYHHLCQTHSLQDIAAWLCDLMTQVVDKRTSKSTQSASKDLGTRAWVLAALQSMQAHSPAGLQGVTDVVMRYQHSVSTDLQQRCHEFLELRKTPSLMQAVLPRDSSAIDFEIDADLGFLDGYVGSALSAGAKPYSPPSESSANASAGGLLGQGRKGSSQAKELNFTPYATPTQLQQTTSYTDPTPTLEGPSSSAFTGGAGGTGGALSLGGAGAGGGGAAGGLQLSGVTSKWGPAGYNDPTQAATAAAQAAAAAPSSSSTAPAYAAASGGSAYGSPSQGETKPPLAQAVNATATAVKPQPRQLTDREKKAQALFGGMAGGGGGGGGGGMFASKPLPKAALATAQRNAQRKPSASASPSFYSPAPAPTPATAPAVAPAAAAPVDLLSLDIFGGGAPAPAAAAPAAGGGLDLMGDIFGGGSTATPAPQPSPGAPVGASSGGFLDIFGGGGGGASAALPAGGTQGGARLGAAGASAGIKQKLAQLALSPDEIVLASNGPNLYISCQKAWAPTSTLVALYVTNKAAAAAPLQVELRTGNFSVSLADADPSAQVRQQGQGILLAMQSLGAGQTATFILALQYRDVSTFSSQANTLAGQAAGVGFSVPLTARDFLRPTEMTTQVYGPLWGQFGAEVKHELRASMGSSQNFMNVIKTQVGIHPIETRGQDTICAGRVVANVANEQAKMVLLHGRSVNGAVSLIVRSKNPALSKNFLAHAAQSLLAN